MAYSPVLVVPKDNPKMAITESDLRDYPGMFLKGTGSDALQGAFAPYPLEEKSTGEFYSQKIVVKRADYIAHTAGTRNFPWRVLMIAAEDKDLPVNDMVYQLAEPSKLRMYHGCIPENARTNGSLTLIYLMYLLRPALIRHPISITLILPNALASTAL